MRNAPRSVLVAGAFSTLSGLPGCGTTLPVTDEDASPAPRRGRVLGVAAAACYLQLDPQAAGPDAGPVVVPILRPDAVQLPTGIRIGSVGPWPAAVGDEFTCDHSGIALGSWHIAPTRWWRPRSVTPAAPGCGGRALRRLDAARPRPAKDRADRLPHHRPRAPLPFAAALPGRPWESERAGLHSLAARLATGTDDAGDAQMLVAALVGLGPGLTPSGDDVIAGVLLTLRLIHRLDELERVWAQVLPRLSATTTLSASLLRAAARGYAAPEVVDLLLALACPPRGTSSAGLRELVDAVLSIGHSSGADLLTGVHAALSTWARVPVTPACSPDPDPMKEA